jgi:8-oxo-dGTP pyrophosphatase MutT (NUDIX family)
MGQRYIVFLNDRVIEISEIINTGQQTDDEVCNNYQNQSDLSENVQRFLLSSHCKKLNIFTGNRMAEVWKEFCGLFNLIYAAGGVVSNTKNQFLFIRRLGKWDLPKGKIESNETPEEAALREVEEETGLDNLQLLYALPDTYHIYSTSSGKTYLKKTFWFKMSYEGDSDPKPQTEEDITDVQWFSVNHIHVIRKDTYASLLPLLEQL